jgi:hypothetical protein
VEPTGFIDVVRVGFIDVARVEETLNKPASGKIAGYHGDGLVLGFLKNNNQYLLSL